MSYAAAAALVIEALLIAGLVIALSGRKTMAPPKPQVVMLSFPVVPVAPPPKPVPTPPRKLPVKPPPRPLPKPAHRPMHRPPPARKVEAPDPAPLQAPVMPAPDTLPAPPRPAPVRPIEKPSPAPVAPDIQARFETQVRTAVQSAMRYPYAARLAHIAGRARVSFGYRDGHVSAAKLAISSGYGVLDAAALEAVSSAAYPPPPKNLAGKLLSFEVWVRFYQTGLASDRAP